MSDLVKQSKTKTNNRRENEEVTFATSAATFFQATSNNFALMAKAHFRGSSFFLGNLFIPIMITTGISGLMMASYGLTWTFFFSMTFTGMATYGTVFFEIRKSSIMKNINLTATESATLYCATFMLIGISLSITMFVIILWSIFMDVIGVTPHEFEFYNLGSPVGIWYMDWGLLIKQPALWYYWIEQIILCFSLSFFVEKIVSTQKNFFIFTFAYILAGVFFSGIMSTSLYVTSDGVVKIIDDNTTIEELNGIKSMPPYQWGHGGWIASQFFPHYSANQIVASAFQGSSWQYGYPPFDEAGNFITDANGNAVFNYDEILHNRWYNLNIFDSIDTWQVEYYAVAPWIWSAVLIWISAMIERFDKNRN